MRIVLRPREPGPSFLFIAVETLVLFIAAALAIYFFLYGKNWIHIGTSVGTGLLVMFVFKESWPRPDPVVVISDQGIWDRRQSFGWIQWSDIQEAQIEVNGPFLCLRVKNPDDYISKLPVEQQEKYLLKQTIGFKMLYIDVKGLQGNLLLVLEQIRKKIGTHHVSKKIR